MAEQKTLDSFLETIRQQMSVVEDLIKVESDSGPAINVIVHSDAQFEDGVDPDDVKS